jgi:hypothetical protein
MASPEPWGLAVAFFWLGSPPWEVTAQNSMPLRIDVAPDHFAAGTDQRVDEAPSPAAASQTGPSGSNGRT